MPRQMSPARELEYEELHAFLDFYATHVSGIDPTNLIHPTNVGKLIVAEYGRAKALHGLQQAVNDLVEDLSGQPLEYIKRLDAALRTCGIVTFSEVRRRYASSYRRIMKRRKIRNETEYYLIAGVLADCSTLAPNEERALLGQLVAQYEQGD